MICCFSGQPTILGTWLTVSKENLKNLAFIPSMFPAVVARFVLYARHTYTQPPHNAQGNYIEF